VDEGQAGVGRMSCLAACTLAMLRAIRCWGGGEPLDALPHGSEIAGHGLELLRVGGMAGRRGSRDYVRSA
jgi:hypothetical protein